MRKIIVLSVGEIQMRNDLDNFAIISYRDASGCDIITLQNYSLPKNEKILNHKNILCIILKIFFNKLKDLNFIELILYISIIYFFY